MSETQNQPNSHVEDLIDAYALGILEDEALAQVEAHLETCPACRALLRQAREVAALLLLAPRQVRPLARVKQRLLERIAQEGRPGLDPTIAAPLPDIAPERQGLIESLRQMLSGRKGTAGDAPQLSQAEAPAQQQLQTILRLLRSPHPALWELPGTPEAPNARAHLLGSPEEDTAILIVRGLEPLPPERDYQLWFLRDGKPVGSAVFDVRNNGESQMLVRAPRQLGHYDLAAITPEPAGGSPGPTGPIIIAGQLKAA